MTADEFVLKMNEIELGVSKNAQLLFDKKFIDKHLHSFTFIKKQVLNDDKNELIKLIKNYEVSAVEIGMLTFLDQPGEDVEYIYIGKFEADDIVINKENGE